MRVTGRATDKRAKHPIENASVVEIGVGWDLINSLTFSMLGAKEILAFDHVPHARFERARQIVDGLAAMTAWLADLTGRQVVEGDRKISRRGLERPPSFMDDERSVDMTREELAVTRLAWVVRFPADPRRASHTLSFVVTSDR